jgi:Kelch motif
VLALAACGQAFPSATSAALRTPDAPAVAPKAVASAVASPITVKPSATVAAVPDIVQFQVERSQMQLPTARSRAVALAVDGSILVCGGLTRTGATTGSIEQIDLSSGRVSAGGTLADPVHDAGGATLGGTGFIFGGGRSGPGAIVQRVGLRVPSTTVGSLPAVRADLVVAAIDGEAIIVGGGTPTRYDDRVLATTDGRHFRTVARLLVGVRYPGVAVVGEVAYVVGGSTPAGDSPIIQAIDLRTGVVRIAAHLERGLSHASALVIDGNLVIAGGRTGGLAQDGFWRFDPVSATVAPVGRLPYPVSDTAAVVVDGIGYLIGGEDHGPLASIITVQVR